MSRPSRNGSGRYLYRYDDGSVELNTEAYPRARQIAVVELVMSAINDSVRQFNMTKAPRSKVWEDPTGVYRCLYVDGSGRRGELEFSDKRNRLGDPETGSEISL